MPKKRKKPGPPKTTGNAPMRSIRVHDEEWARWKAAAAKQGVSLGQWIRDQCERGKS